LCTAFKTHYYYFIARCTLIPHVVALMLSRIKLALLRLLVLHCDTQPSRMHVLLDDNSIVQRDTLLCVYKLMNN